MKLQRRFFDAIHACYDSVAQNQTPDGAFRNPDAGYTYLDQYAGYYFAYLYTSSQKGNLRRGSQDALNRAVAGWDYYACFVKPSGKVPVVTHDQYWSETIDEWGLYYWMCTWDLLSDEVARGTRDTWNEKIRWVGEALAEDLFAQMAKPEFQSQVDGGSVLNHYVWSVLATYRYAEFSSQPELRDRAAVLMERIIAGQLACGTWLEKGAPVVAYCEVSVCAVSLYEMFSGSKAASVAVDRALSYVLNTTYPNFSKNECIDGRSWYTRSIFAYTAPTFHRQEDGVGYLSKWIDFLVNVQPIGRRLDRSLQALAVVTDITARLPQDLEEPAQSRSPILGNVWWPEIGTSIRREGPWTVTTCCHAPPAPGSRWFYERQNLVSIYHERLGLMVGGGHSIGHPEFSTICLTARGMVHYLHADGVLHEDGYAASYAGRNCRVRLFINQESVRIRYEVEELGEFERITIHLPMPKITCDTLSLDGVAYPLGEDDVSVRVPAESWLGAGGAKFRSTSAGRLMYPVDGYTPYVRQRASDPARRHAVLSFELFAWQKECEVEIREIVAG